MSKRANNETFDVGAFVKDMYGETFPSYLTLWSKQTKRTEFFPSSELNELVATVERRKSTEDLYFGLSTQVAALSPKSRGRADSVAIVPGFFADIDFAQAKDSEKNYPSDEKTALKILKKFEHQPSLIQRSGNGLHALWFLGAQLVCKTRKDRRRAKALVRIFQQKIISHYRKHGYDIDNVGDLVRLYRVPGTFNHKSSPPKPVEVIHYDPTIRVPVGAIEMEEQDEQSAGRQEPWRFPPADHHLIADGCSWYGHHTGEGAATSDEPNWHGAASITCRCKDGERIFHEFSRRHPDYKRREAAQKFKRALEEAGPRTCEAIRKDLGNDDFCSKCPHWGMITTPLQLGRTYDPGEVGPIPLGYTSNGMYILRDQKRQIIISATAQQLLSYQYLLGLAPSGFWFAQYPGDKGRFNFMQAGEDLIAACKRKGPFDATRVRGRGVWRERGFIIINLGDPLPHNLSHTYLCFRPLAIESSTNFETERLYRLLQLFPWRNPQDAKLLLGWLAAAPICGALDWRPHAFIYGPPNSGKTTLHNLASKLLDPLRVSSDGQSTEAGIRQSLGADALPVVIDEFETDQRQRRLEGVIRLARSASSADSPVLRGTPEGNALHFAIRTMFLFSAINVVGMSPQDESRFLVTELEAHSSDPEVGRTIETERQIFQDLGPQWCGYMASHANDLLQAIDTFNLELASVESRHRLNMATLLAGAFVALKGQVPTSSEASEWIAELRPTLEFHGQLHERDDALECLDFLLAHTVAGSAYSSDTLAHWIGYELACLNEDRNDNTVRESARVLSTYGMRFWLKRKPYGLLIRNGSPAIDRVFANTKWANGAWQRALKQIPGSFSLKYGVDFKGCSSKQRSVGLPLELIPKPLYEPLPPIT